MADTISKTILISPETLHEKLSDALSDVASLSEQLKDTRFQNKQLQDLHVRLDADNQSLSSQLSKTRASMQAQSMEFRTRETGLMDSLHEITQNVRRVSSRITLEGVHVTDFRGNKSLISSLLGWIMSLKDYHLAFCLLVGTQQQMGDGFDVKSASSELPTPSDLRKIFAAITGWMSMQGRVLTSGSNTVPGDSRWNEVIAEDVARIANVMEDLMDWYSRLHECEEGTYEELMSNARLNLFANEMLAVKQDLLRHWTLKLKAQPTTTAIGQIMASLGGSFLDSSLLDALLKMATINSRMAALTAIQNNVARAWVGKNRSIPESAYSNGEVPYPIHHKTPKTNGASIPPPLPVPTSEASNQTQPGPELLTSFTQTKKLMSQDAQIATDGTPSAEAESQAGSSFAGESKDAQIETEGTDVHDVEPREERINSSCDANVATVVTPVVETAAQTESGHEVILLQDAKVSTDLTLSVEMAMQTEQIESTGNESIVNEIHRHAVLQASDRELTDTASQTDPTLASSSAPTTDSSTSPTDSFTITPRITAADAVNQTSTSVSSVMAQPDAVSDAASHKSIEPITSDTSSYVEVRARLSDIRKMNGEPLVKGVGEERLQDVVTVRKILGGGGWDVQQITAIMERLEVAEAKAVRFERLLASMQQ
ncbi:hypothetical protein HDU67_000774 [Dinochytrium kinnereticum]|nr:hypothetical protein HDU67_000774 [Dinochytrium kinnereticum]